MRAIPLSTMTLGAVLSLAGGGPAVATTSILNCPYTIMQPGIYQLGRSLTCSGDAITVQANGVQVFLGSRTLTGNGTGAGVFAQGVTDLTGRRIHAAVSAACDYPV